MPDELAAAGQEQLHGYLADQAQPDHAHPLAELRPSAPHSLQGDGPNRGSSGHLEVSPRGDRAYELARDANVFGVVGEPGAGAR